MSQKRSPPLASASFMDTHNWIMEEYNRQQAAIDTLFEDMIDKNVALEKARIVGSSQPPVKSGDRVQYGEKLGTVVDTSLYLNVCNSDYYAANTGPDQFGEFDQSDIQLIREGKEPLSYHDLCSSAGHWRAQVQLDQTPRQIETRRKGKVADCNCDHLTKIEEGDTK